jgi:hypothetical protein
MRYAERNDSEYLYQHSAALFDIRYAQKDYAAEAARFSKLAKRIHPAAATPATWRAAPDFICSTCAPATALRVSISAPSC